MRIKSNVRYELKYLINWQQREALQEELAAYMVPDGHGDLHGNYAITSLYYDTAAYRAYWEKVEGESYRRKVRLRTYGTQTVQPDSPVFLEIKQRQNKTLTKKRVELLHYQAQDLDALNQIEEASPDDRAVLNEIDYLQRTLALQPSCIVRYNRRAFNGGPQYSDLRVTFDTELRARGHDLTLLSTGHAQDLSFVPPQLCIMEIKVNSSVPYWLAQLIYRQRCVLRRMSKYCLALEACQKVQARQTVIY